MPRKKIVPATKKISTKVPEVVTSATADVDIVFNQGISPLELDLGRDDLNKLVEKLNEVIRKVNS